MVGPLSGILSAMPIRLDYDLARRRFAEAVDLARSDADLPLEWLEHTRKIGQGPSKTFVAMLGTALLAKATDARVDPFSLKVRDYPYTYSARALCKDVLVPASVRAGVSLGTTGREPLNNQPFFRHERVGPEMVVIGRARPYLDYLASCLGELEQMDGASSVVALAAFVRIRSQEAPGLLTLELGTRVLGLSGLVQAMAEFVSADPEGGRRGQAFVAAALDLVFPEVRTRRVNDPSRRSPGDVVVVAAGTLTLAAEVKQRPATETEILQFVERLSRDGVERGLVAALDPRQPPLPVSDLRALAWERHQVHLMIFEDPRDLLLAAFTWSSEPLGEALMRFPQLVASRLQELEVSPKGIEDWLAIFAERE